MAQTELNRLLIIPAIVLAATMSLSGCANLPFFGNDSGSSNNSSSKDDDEDDEDDDQDQDEDDNDSGGTGGCPQKFLDTTQQSSGTADFDEITVTEISPDDFVPSVLGDYLDGGCLLELSYTQDNVPGTIYEAFIPGGAETLAELDTALVDGGYDNSTKSFYVGDENSFVVVYSNDDSALNQDDLDEQGMGFLGDEFIVITAYKGEV